MSMTLTEKSSLGSMEEEPIPRVGPTFDSRGRFAVLDMTFNPSIPIRVDPVSSCQATCPVAFGEGAARPQSGYTAPFFKGFLTTQALFLTHGEPLPQVLKFLKVLEVKDRGILGTLHELSNGNTVIASIGIAGSWFIYTPSRV